MNPDNKGITIITSHVNADFDAMASMLAAQKLYPGSRVVFPGSCEKNLRNFFVESMVYLFNMLEIKDIDFSQINRLVLVDTKQSGRIGELSKLLDRTDIEIHIYDHHPKSQDDIHGHYEYIQLTGATISILAEIIKERGIEITADESTIMCLGIYEDTGSFTFSSTTEKDFIAAAFFLSKGANLDVISSIMAQEISPLQVGILNDMLLNATHYTINNIDIVITSVTTEEYVDVAVLVHKMINMEEIDVIFALARMESKIYIVARSQIPEVDAAEVVKYFGGGGHPYAASATIKDKALAQTEKELLDILYQKVKSHKRAKNLMSSPAITVSPNISCQEARDILTRYNLNALLVTEKSPEGKDILHGYISRQVIAKAIFLMNTALVGDYMTTEIGFVTPDAEITEIQEKIISNNQRLLPVIENGVVKGVITRTDLLHTLVQSTHAGKLDPYRDETGARTRNIIKFMNERLPEKIIKLLVSVGEVAEELGYIAYVVGGFVRDLFLYRINEDLDIVIEGNGMAFAEEFARRNNARANVHKKFGTAVVIFPDGFKIDVASARMEYYRFPADLPSVVMSSIKMDLFRRDFTINTLAINLNPGNFGILIDYFSALRDIKEKIIRILHNLSFVEDPTRIFRAIRFEQRFRFSIGKLTASLIQNAVRKDFFKQLSGKRVFNELRQILGESDPGPAISRLHDFNLLVSIDPALSPEKRLPEMFESVKNVLAWHNLLFLDESCSTWVVYFMVMIRHCDNRHSESICKKFEIPSRLRIFFCKDRFDAEKCLKWLNYNMPVENSVLYRTLSSFKIEVLLFMMAVTEREDIKKSISNYLTNLRYVFTSITGKDLKKMGVLPGPVYREILEAVLDAKLNGKVTTRNDEIIFARNYVS